MRAQGPIVIKNLGDLLLDVDKLKYARSKHQMTIHIASTRLIEKLATLYEVIDMKMSVNIQWNHQNQTGAIVSLEAIFGVYH